MALDSIDSDEFRPEMGDFLSFLTAKKSKVCLGAIKIRNSRAQVKDILVKSCSISCSNVSC